MIQLGIARHLQASRNDQLYGGLQLYRALPSTDAFFLALVSLPRIATKRLGAEPAS